MRSSSFYVGGTGFKVGGNHQAPRSLESTSAGAGHIDSHPTIILISAVMQNRPGLGRWFLVSVSANERYKKLVTLSPRRKSAQAVCLGASLAPLWIRTSDRPNLVALSVWLQYNAISWLCKMQKYSECLTVGWGALIWVQNLVSPPSEHSTNLTPLPRFLSSRE